MTHSHVEPGARLNIANRLRMHRQNEGLYQSIHISITLLRRFEARYCNYHELEKKREPPYATAQKMVAATSFCGPLGYRFTQLGLLLHSDDGLSARSISSPAATARMSAMASRPMEPAAFARPTAGLDWEMRIYSRARSEMLNTIRIVSYWGSGETLAIVSKKEENVE